MSSFVVFKFIFSYSKWPPSQVKYKKSDTLILQIRILITFNIKLQLFFVNIVVERLNQITYISKMLIIT